MVIGNSLKTFVRARTRGTMNAILNLDNMVKHIHSCNLNLKKHTLKYNTKPDLKIKSRKKGVTKSPPP